MFSFFLPNNKEIDIEAVMAALEDVDSKKLYLLDTNSGKVKVVLNSTEAKKLEKSSKNKNQAKKYLPIPNLPKEIVLSWMQEYVEDLVEWGEKQAREKLAPILDGKNALQRFKEEMSSDPGWEGGWECWKGDNLFNEMEMWLASLEIPVRREVELPDEDCPLCQMMLDGQDSFQELRAAFQEAKDQSTIVGGEWFGD